MSEARSELLRIGQIARAAGVGVDTVRFYERRGLLPRVQRSNSGYRLYPPQTVTRLSFIRRAKDLGFSLDEVASLLMLQDTGGSKSDVKAITHRKLEAISAKIEDLTRMRDVLQQLDNDCSGRGNVKGCPIIETLSESRLEDPAT